MNKIMNRIRKELLEILPAFIFFLAMFHILVVTRALVLKQYGIAQSASAVAIVGALLVAKAILITDKIPFLNSYPEKPLIWNVVLKTIIFTAITFLFLFIEGTIRHARHHECLAAALKSSAAEFTGPTFWIRDMWLTVLLLFYCAVVELVRVVGPGKVKEIFIGRSKG